MRVKKGRGVFVADRRERKQQKRQKRKKEHDMKEGRKK
jgi:hypothetical protein